MAGVGSKRLSFFIVGAHRRRSAGSAGSAGKGKRFADHDHMLSAVIDAVSWREMAKESGDVTPERERSGAIEFPRKAEGERRTAM